MPWTPFFLKHLLDYDCPIVIGEGASDVVQFKNPRSSDGSLELINLFAVSWPDRVSVFPHSLSDRSKKKGRAGRNRPKHMAKMFAMSKLSLGDWMVGLAPDNYYRREQIPQLKRALVSAAPQFVTAYTGMRVFAYSFKTLVTARMTGVCGPWLSLWPCIYRRDEQFGLRCGNELIANMKTRRILGGSTLQANLKIKRKHVLMLPGIKNFHYKSVKTLANRRRRLKSQYSEWFKMTGVGHGFRPYEKEHPSVLDLHPWRNVPDCRKAPQKWNWEDFAHLVERR